MKKVKVIAPLAKKDVAKVKTGRIIKKDKTKNVGGPGSTPFCHVKSQVKDVLINEAKNFSLSKKKLANVRASSDCQPQVETPTSARKKRGAKKANRNDADLSVAREESENVAPETVKAVKRPSQRQRKKSKSLNSATETSAAAEGDGDGKRLVESKCPLLIPSNVSNAIKALRKNIEQFKSKQTKLVDEPTSLILTVEFFKLPRPAQIHSRALLPHSTVTDLHEVCFFVRDPKKRKNEADDDDSYEDEVREVLKKHGVENISEIWPWKKFARMHTQFEEKKKFADRFDFILADSVVSYRWMGVLNKTMFKNKYPIPVRYAPESLKLKKEFDNALRKVQVRVEGRGLTSACVFGHDGLTDAQLSENLEALCLFLSDKDKYPGGAANIRTLSVKSPRSAAFPIFISLASPNKVEVPKKVSKRQSAAVVGELTTLYNDRDVKVYPDGRVYEVKRLKKVEEVENNSSPVKKVQSRPLVTESDDSNDEDETEDHSEQRQAEDEASSDEDEEEKVEQEYLEELREMQAKPKQLSKKKASEGKKSSSLVSPTSVKQKNKSGAQLVENSAAPRKQKTGTSLSDKQKNKSTALKKRKR